VDNRKQSILAVVGPTASGKTALAVKLAERFGGEIVSADSRAVYRDMDIGTAKVTPEEARGIPHHLIDVARPDTQYTVADYVRDARAAIKDIAARGKLPIVCGGTTFYLDALFGEKNIPAVPPNAELRAELEEKTAEELYGELKELDPRRAGDIDSRNKRRLIRALEIIRATGKPVPRNERNEVGLPSMEGREGSPTSFHSGYEVTLVAPYRTREELKERIAERVYKRWDSIIAETKKLREKYGLAWEKLDSFGLEYRYAARFLTGRLEEKEAQERLIAATWRYAKHQLAWCAKRPVTHLSASDVDKLPLE